MNEVLKTIKNRRSVRHYSSEQICQESLDLILDAGGYAPSAHNQQTWHFTVIQNQKLLEHINETVRREMAGSEVEWIRKMGSNPDFLVTYNAPTLIIVSGRTDGIAWAADCAAAIQNMLLAAESLDIGSVWLGLLRFFFEEKKNKDLLGIPDGYEPYYGVSFGYKVKDKIPVVPKRNLDVVNYIR
ncbi:MAG: FMN reductase [NAD(P)H] [Candidatus Dichloromethanomonas elyunquensis]|nr:MAG: FMN reductase [NAD(P)H] [Candidatus Dichloromethanomonas elyunquensis]